MIELLRGTLTLSEDRSVWFAREVELVRVERLIDEAAHFRVLAVNRRVLAVRVASSRRSACATSR